MPGSTGGGEEEVSSHWSGEEKEAEDECSDFWQRVSLIQFGGGSLNVTDSAVSHVKIIVFNCLKQYSNCPPLPFTALRSQITRRPKETEKRRSIAWLTLPKALLLRWESGAGWHNNPREITTFYKNQLFQIKYFATCLNRHTLKFPFHFRPHSF